MNPRSNFALYASFIIIGILCVASYRLGSGNTKLEVESSFNKGYLSGKDYGLELGKFSICNQMDIALELHPTFSTQVVPTECIEMMAKNKEGWKKLIDEDNKLRGIK